MNYATVVEAASAAEVTWVTTVLEGVVYIVKVLEQEACVLLYSATNKYYFV